jgi:hypothetical protein
MTNLKRRLPGPPSRCLPAIGSRLVDFNHLEFRLSGMALRYLPQIVFRNACIRAIGGYPAISFYGQTSYLAANPVDASPATRAVTESIFSTFIVLFPANKRCESRLKLQAREPSDGLGLERATAFQAITDTPHRSEAHDK